MDFAVFNGFTLPDWGGLCSMWCIRAGIMWWGMDGRKACTYTMAECRRDKLLMAEMLRMAHPSVGDDTLVYFYLLDRLSLSACQLVHRHLECWKGERPKSKSLAYDSSSAFYWFIEKIIVHNGMLQLLLRAIATRNNYRLSIGIAFAYCFKCWIEKNRNKEQQIGVAQPTTT